MTSQQGTVLVTGATGQQGGAVTRQLLARGWKVRALVRNPQKAEARWLYERGVEIVRGDLDDTSSIIEAMQGMYGVFSVQGVLNDTEKEVRQGKAVADAAQEAGVSHLVYSSVMGAGRAIGIEAFAAKWEIEEHIRSLESLPATILQPVMFMDNFRPLLHATNGPIEIPNMGSPNMRVQIIAAEDIGVFAAVVFSEPERYRGQIMAIAGDELTFTQMAEVLQKVLERPVHYQIKAMAQDQGLEGARKASEFFEREGYKADIASLHRIHPQLLSFETWVRRTVDTMHNPSGKR